MPEYVDRAQLFAVSQFSSHDRHNHRRLALAHVELHHRILVARRMDHSVGNVDLERKMGKLKIWEGKQIN